MKYNKAICSPDFYENVGFNTIRAWLREHCLCTLNESYFHELEPLCSKVAIEESQLFSDELLASFQRNSPLPMENIPNITETLSILEIAGAQLNSDHFQELYQTLNSSSHIKRALKKNVFPLWYINSRNLLNSTVAISAIKKVFDDSFQIKLDASSELKQLSRAIMDMEMKIKDTMVRLMSRARSKSWLQGEQVVWRNGRSMLPMKVNQKRKIKGIIQDQSATGQTAYVEPMEIIDLNNLLGDLYFKHIEEKKRILRELTAYFYPMAGKIQESFHILKHLDRHFTIAKLTYKLKGVRPELNDTGEILLEKATNPLFILAGKNVVSLDLELKKNKILLLSGPNAGGKTVVLKSLGLYAIMAQCGIYIPAKKARLPLFSQFMADIGDRQSIEDDLSTFSAHIKNLAEIIQTVDNNSLVLLDELGTGTDPDAGAALSRAILETLLKSDANVIATTHLSALKAWAFDAVGVTNGGMIFDSDALAPTYELLMGIPGASYALEISKRMGLGDDIINRSKKLVSDGSVSLENILIKLDKNLLEAESLQLELQQREKKLAQIETGVYDREKEIKDIHKKAKSTAALEAEEIILSARRNVENLISDIRNSQADKESIQKSKKQLNQTLRKLQSQSQKIEFDSDSISKNDAVKDTHVYIPKLNSPGKIIHSPDKNNKIRVKANGITLTLKLSELQLAPISEKSTKQSKTKFPTNKYSVMKSIQIDLRGKRVDEALRETEKFMDAALVSGLGFVKILHGKGTGALMEAIHEYLKDQSFVSDFRFADDDWGGVGITVVKLK